MPRIIPEVQYMWWKMLQTHVIEDFGWYILHNGSYLHADGKLRASTRNLDTNEYTGYFTTYGEAKFLYNKYLGDK